CVGWGCLVPKATITQSFVRRIQCPANTRKIDFFESRFPGFLLEVRSSGGKTFYQRYRDVRGGERQFKIGSGAGVTVAAARKLAPRIAADALLGTDPQAERQELRAIPTLSEFVHDSYLQFAKNTKRSWRTDETILRLHILPSLGRLPLDQISNQAIAEL